jgi:hypothetical protein
MRAPEEAQLLWRDGDRWRTLNGELAARGAATIISEHGTARFIDFDRRRHIRQPLEGGNVVFGDRSWMPFAQVAVTPCGVVLDHPQFWARSTPLRLVFAGFVDTWMSTAAGRDAVHAAVRRIPPTSPGHPDEPCAAYYCTRRQP